MTFESIITLHVYYCHVKFVVFSTGHQCWFCLFISPSHACSGVAMGWTGVTCLPHFCPRSLEFGRFTHRTLDIGNIGAKLNIEKSVTSMRRYRCWKKINVKACNVVFTLITLKQHSFIVQTDIWNQQIFLHLKKTVVFTLLAAVIGQLSQTLCRKK